MRKRYVRNSFDFADLQHPKIGLPLVESIERIMIRAKVFWQAVPANRSLEHAAQRHTINDAAENAKPDDTTCKLVHSPREPNVISALPIRSGIDRSSISYLLCGQET